MKLPGRLVIASHNSGKVAEIADLLEPFAVQIVGAAELGLTEPDETGTTFEANAILKACLAMQASRLPALADDSGLAVDALEGAPGIHSARWAGPERNFSGAIARLERALEGHLNLQARFHCVLALVWPDGATRIFHGRVEGTLSFPAKGCYGFGYDPVFVPEGDHRTYAEMSMAEKLASNHRARAFAALTAALT